VSTVWTGYGRPAYGELRSAVASCKADDPLAPVTVIVPSNLAGVLVRRALAAGFGRCHGIAGLTVLTLDRLAERIAAPALAGSGRRPVTRPVLAAAWRRALAAEPGVFRPAADHPSTVRALADAHRELREVDDAGLDAIGSGGAVAADLVRLHRRVIALLRENWYDVHDLCRVATQNLAGDATGSVSRARDGIGAGIVFLPQDLPVSGQELLARLPDLITIEGFDRETAATTVLHASDADDEVRCMVRRIATALHTTPAHRIAVLYGSARPYARLLDEHLHAAGIRWNGAGVRPTVERRLARLLRNLFVAHHGNWRRSDVLAVLADAPAVGGTARWERISRAAGVIGGEDWEVRLKAYATQKRDHPETDRGNSEAAAADDLRHLVTDLQARLREGESLTTWPALAEWTRQTYALLTGDLEIGDHHHNRLPEDDQRAAAAVLRTIDALPGLAGVEPAADLTLLDLTLDLELAGDLPRHGRIGEGVLVGPMSAAIGLDADQVFVLGLTDDLVPGRIGADALLPEEVRELAEGQLATAKDRIDRKRRHVFAAFAAAPIVTASFARGDLRRSTTRLPSRWLQHGAAIAKPSYAAGLGATSELATEQEWRIRAAAANALPPDRIIELSREMRDARAENRLTRFDGDLSGCAPEDPTAGPAVSPTALESWTRCPHSYFVKRLLGVSPLETPEEQLTISPIELGNLYHRALDQFFIEERADLRRIAIEVADDLSARGATGHRLLWERELTGVLARLDQFLDTDDELRAATGRRQVRSELMFGMHGEPPVALPLRDGRTLLMKGSADRVDRAGDAIVVVDYKSGNPRSFAGLGPDDPTLGGAKLQLPVYGLAARLALGAPDAPVSAEYWFLHRDAGRRVELDLTPAVEAAFIAAVTVIVDGIASGLFPHRPPDDDGWGTHIPCGYCDPDALGASEHRERWTRKRNDPRLAAYVALIEGSA
jgi:ATP-dependent helicase/nuclease subunit B